ERHAVDCADDAIRRAKMGLEVFDLKEGHGTSLSTLLLPPRPRGGSGWGLFRGTAHRVCETPPGLACARPPSPMTGRVKSSFSLPVFGEGRGGVLSAAQAHRVCETPPGLACARPPSPKTGREKSLTTAWPCADRARRAGHRRAS